MYILIANALQYLVFNLKPNAIQAVIYCGFFFLFEFGCKVIGQGYI